LNQNANVFRVFSHPYCVRVSAFEGKAGLVILFKLPFYSLLSSAQKSASVFRILESTPQTSESVEAAEMTCKCLEFMNRNRRKFRFTEKMIIQEEKPLKRFTKQLRNSKVELRIKRNNQS
jgi:hypothetical protein